MSVAVSIDRALPDELDIVLKILDDAARWLTEQQIDQWPRSFSQDATWRTQRIRSYIEHGLTYLVRDGQAGEPVATFTLSKAADPQFAHGWPDGPDTGGYIFRIAVIRSAAGRDIGGTILDWATDEVARWGKRWLRLDVHRYNPKLHEYYERHGFQKVAEVTAPDLSVPGRTRGSGTLMQRPTRLVGEDGDLNASNYDPDGTASIWLEASNLVDSLKLESPPVSEDAWNAALDQAARRLERHATEIRQVNGMYYRTMSGRTSDDGS